MMRKIMQPAAVLGLLLGTVLVAAPAQAQATRTWVSGVGDDVNPCSRTAPCKTFAGAISKTAVNGEINCLDPGGFGTLTITKSITVDWLYIPGSVLNAGLSAFNIPFDSAGFNADVRRTVRIRGINMQGADTGTGGVTITGGAVNAGGKVIIEESLIDGNFAGNARGVSDSRTGGGELYISKTVIRNLGGTGIVVLGGGTKLDVSVNDVKVLNANQGIAVGTNVKAMIRHSVFSGHTGQGVDVEGAGAEANVTDSVTSNNGTGLLTAAGGVLRMANTDITLNGTGASGAWVSYGNNRFIGNTTAGTGPTAAGGPAEALGQQ
jgi:hypothetical protein